ncbi:MATE efflux family protein [Paenibacillus terrae HPL-003]|uniref:MATE efflux family protein n=1 Tax=Paenibacillus terrae (strain HPL-003) TaxID=985665 RepID=G7VR77_PAETH|nr:MATE family efflux transporter [Paenibacillus terrae]AET61976.1 MATE efflux family protein [Paenibacillus terrae HPL-003]
MRQTNFIGTFHEDKAFLKGFLLLSLPIGLQSMLTSITNTFASLMVGQLGDLQVSATSLAGQVFFILNLIIVGIVSGSTIFLSQYYGKGDHHNLKVASAVAFALVLAVSALFTVIALLFPTQVLHIFSNEYEVVEQAANYLQIVGISYLPTGLSLACTMIYRNIGRAGIPLRIIVLTIIIDVVLSYLLIFGYAGLPVLGIQGAAIAIVMARTIEMLIMTSILYSRFRSFAPTIRDLLSAQKSFLTVYFKTSAPVILNETVWSIGYAMYSVVFYHMGYTVGAAVGIAKVLEQLLIAFFIGTGQAAAIILGQTIGEGKSEKAPYYSSRMATYTALGGVLLGIIMMTCVPLFLNLYQGISQEVRNTIILLVMYLAVIMPIKGMNFIHIMGTLRAGGDTRMCFVIDNATLWCVSLPLTFLTGYALNLGIEIVFLFVILDDLCKYMLVRLRIRSNKWIHNLVE